MTHQLLTNSRRACVSDCLRKHYLRYELGIRQERDGAPLRFGSAFHLARETHDLGKDAVEAVRALNTLDPYEQEAVVRMHLAYLWRWGKDGYQVVVPEQEFELPLVNPETGAETPVWHSAGKMDRIVTLGDGRLALQEYKTTSDDLAPGSEYWVLRRLDQQIQLYFLAAREAGFPVQAVIYDVTRRPDLSPKDVPLLDAAGEKIVLDASGDRVMTKDGKRWRQTGDAELGYVMQKRTETVDEFGERLTADIVSRPDHYFARVELPLLTDDLVEFQHELWQQQLAIRAAQRSGHWFRNTNACQRPGRTCEYLHVCGRRDLETVTPEGFIRSDELHPELSLRGASRATDATPEASPALQ